MIAALRHHRFRVAFVWLALAAVLLRGMLPAGYMPVQAGSGQPGIRIALCSGGTLHVDGHGPAGHQVQQNECPFALSAMAAIPPSLTPAGAIEWRAAVPAIEAGQVSVVAALPLHPPARGPPVYS